jgi:hypothetical protein
MTVDLFSQSLPVELHERMFLRDFAHHSLRDPRSVSQSRKVQLPHFSAPAHVVHQVESVSFAANKSHEPHPVASNLAVVYCTSTTGFNICFVTRREIAPKALTLLQSFVRPLTAVLRVSRSNSPGRYANEFEFRHHFFNSVAFTERIEPLSLLFRAAATPACLDAAILRYASCRPTNSSVIHRTPQFIFRSLATSFI